MSQVGQVGRDGCGHRKERKDKPLTTEVWTDVRSFRTCPVLCPKVWDEVQTWRFLWGSRGSKNVSPVSGLCRVHPSNETQSTGVVLCRCPRTCSSPPSSGRDGPPGGVRGFGCGDGTR